MTPPSTPSFYQADRETFRRVTVVGTLFCAAFMVISFSLRPQMEEGSHVLVKADRPIRTAGQPPQTH
ncbi:hypothetical protein QA640_22530 [Bradyrhizobium sp. CB82]|uniref:hypothetical protein n=1 Tax=Bradyrhizobium sp. CB82 TaxID=3039159 RepID=UPI0024B15FFF|nr:hypothetical protein [Bradyrhizobium sp. CB82]WFU37275.1 hypothetical protein QA640_22530 [Bradyrhizobium sp. CB82]